MPFGQARHDLSFPLETMVNERLNEGLYIPDRRAVGGPVDVVGTLQQTLQARHVLGHVPIGWGNHAGGPAHDMIPGKQRALFREGVAHVIGSVAGSVDTLDGPAIAGDGIAIPDRNVWHEVHIASSLHLHALVDFAGPMGTVPIRLRAPDGLQRSGGRVIHMRVSNQDVGNGLVLE